MEVLMTDMTPNFDVTNDFVTYIKNNRDFYPKYYYPAMSRASDIMDMKKPIKPKHFMSMIRKGMDCYCKDYNLGNVHEVFDKDIIKAIMQVILSDEIPRIRKGDYRCA